MLSSVEFSAHTEGGKRVNMISIDKIKKVVEEAEKFPNCHIEYNGELPDYPGISEDSFLGVKAVFNQRVPKSTQLNLIYKF